MSDISEKWDQRYLSATDNFPQPASVLKEYSHLIPPHGIALDIACGLGGNALFLAKTGLSVHAWDISNVAIEKLKTHALSKQQQIMTQVRDVIAQPPAKECFDIIVVSYFLDRSLAKSIHDALRPNGLLFYQTFTRNKATEAGPKNPDFLLSENELLKLFGELHLLAYREEGVDGNIKQGFRNEALFVGKKL